MSAIPPGDVAAVMTAYFDVVVAHLERLRDTQGPAVRAAAALVADQIAADELVYVYGPGGHSTCARRSSSFAPAV